MIIIIIEVVNYICIFVKYSKMQMHLMIFLNKLLPT